MLMFLASVLDQMDRALEHVKKDSVHDARIGLMLTDNAIELAMHELAKTKDAELKLWRHRSDEYQHKSELAEALGRVFDAKVKFAKIEGLVNGEQARTITLLHDFRNELYHIGLQHEAILPALSRFYFSVACDILSAYPIRGFSYHSKIELPVRSKKYFTNKGKYSPAEIGDFARAFRTMSAACGHQKRSMIRTLADHMEATIEDSDNCLDIVAQGVYEGQQQTRDQATVECQTWPLSFSEEAYKYARDNGFVGETRPELLEWLAKNYPLRFKMDPVPSWKKQVTRLRSKGNPHTALEYYVAFMEHTTQIREAFSGSAAAAEQEIDRLIEEYRNERN